MEKKFKLSDKPRLVKIIYASVIAILCITAIVLGIVSASSKSPSRNDTENPPISSDDDNKPTPPEEDNKKEEEDGKLTFVSPTVGSVTKSHSLSAPVFSLTLGEWRVHTGIDISCEEGATIYAAEKGTVSGVYNDPLLGYTVEITHNDDIKTRYSNLDASVMETCAVGNIVCSGDKIGTVGDSSVSELADEAHLHFEFIVKDVKVNPLDYISDESKEASLGIKNDE